MNNNCYTPGHKRTQVGGNQILSETVNPQDALVVGKNLTSGRRSIVIRMCKRLAFSRYPVYDSCYKIKSVKQFQLLLLIQQYHK